jgi:hypothetical protein
MDFKIIYGGFVWFDGQVKGRRCPNTTSVAEKFELSTKTAQRDIELMRDRLLCPLYFTTQVKSTCSNSFRRELPEDKIPY